MDEIFQKVNEKIDLPHPSSATPRRVPAPKMTKNSVSINMVVSYIIGKLLHRRFQKVNEKVHLSNPLLAPLKKLVPCPKMTKSGYH